MSVPKALRRTVGRTLRAIDRVVPSSQGIAALAYHRVGGTTPVSVDLPLDQVAEQFDWLVDSATTISLDEAASQLVGPANGHVSRPAVVLTADDGTTDWVDALLPLLVDRRLPMTWYVATAFIEEQQEFPNGGRPVSWAGLRDAVATGLITVASHTHTHAVMANLDAAAARAELDRSIGLVEDRLAVACQHFAYPKAIAPSAAAETEVRRRFRTAALAGNRVNVPGRTDLARLGRTPVQEGHDLARFEAMVSGRGRVEGWAREHFDRRRHRHAVS